MKNPSDDRALGADVRRRAAELLGISGDLQLRAVRPRILREVDGADYLPPTAWRDALEAFGSAQGAALLHCGPALRLEIESGLAEEIARFAAEFFSLAPEPRRACWVELAGRACYSPALRIWLADFEPGLSICLPAPGDDSAVAELIRRITILFPQRPDHKARLAAEIVESFADRPRVARTAAARIRRAHPGLAALVPQLLDELERLPSREKRRARWRAAQDRPRKLWYRAGRSSWRGTVRTLRAIVHPNFRRTVFVALLLIIAGVGKFFDSGKRQKPQPPEPRAFFGKGRSLRGVSPDLRRLLGIGAGDELTDDESYQPGPPPLPGPEVEGGELP